MICGQFIAVQETWCNPHQENLHLQLPGYEILLVNQGQGKGIATFYKNDFEENCFINKPLYQTTFFQITIFNESKNALKGGIIVCLSNLFIKSLII